MNTEAGAGGRDVTTSPGPPGAPRSWRRRGKVPQSPQERRPADTVIPDSGPPGLGENPFLFY